MTTVVVLFNLKESANVEAYEAWATATDLPIVRALGSVDSFAALRSVALLGSDDKPPYEYIEVINVNDMERFGTDIGTDKLQKVAAEFQEFADNPLFIMTESLG